MNLLPQAGDTEIVVQSLRQRIARLRFENQPRLYFERDFDARFQCLRRRDFV